MFFAPSTYWRKLKHRMASALAACRSAKWTAAWQRFAFAARRPRPHWSKSGFRRLEIEQCEVRTMLSVNVSGDSQVPIYHTGGVTFSETQARQKGSERFS